MSDDDVRLLKNMGALGYPADKIVAVMGDMDGAGVITVAGIVGEDKFIKEFNNPKSQIRRIYNAGADLAQYQIDLKLFEMSRAGDLKAMEKLDRRKRSMAAPIVKKRSDR